MSIALPNEYIAYIESDGVSEEFTEGLPGYFALWHPDEIEANNKDLQVETYAPGFLGFGTDGGGELLAFDSTGAPVTSRCCKAWTQALVWSVLLHQRVP